MDRAEVDLLVVQLKGVYFFLWKDSRATTNNPNAIISVGLEMLCLRYLMNEAESVIE